MVYEALLDRKREINIKWAGDKTVIQALPAQGKNNFAWIFFFLWCNFQKVGDRGLDDVGAEGSTMFLMTVKAMKEEHMQDCI